MNLNELITGLTILRAHYDQPDGYHLSAEHDEIFLDATQTPLSPEGVQKMIDAGWFQELHDSHEDDFAVVDYDPQEGWKGYT